MADPAEKKPPRSPLHPDVTQPLLKRRLAFSISHQSRAGSDASTIHQIDLLDSHVGPFIQSRLSGEERHMDGEERVVKRVMWGSTSSKGKQKKVD